jgi:hypothetical protein
MNRKLHNTVTALFATSGLLALSLMAGNPVPADMAVKPAPAAQLARVEVAASRLEAQARDLDRKLQSHAAVELAGLTTQAATLAAVAEAIDQAEAAKTETASARPARRSHRGRQSVAMPFFSFFPKG